MNGFGDPADTTTVDGAQEPKQSPLFMITRCEAQALARYWIGEFADCYQRWRVGDVEPDLELRTRRVAQGRIEKLIEVGLVLADEVPCLLGEVLRERGLP